MSKTGTSSLYLALQRLGLKGCHTCMQLNEYIENPSTFWIADSERRRLSRKPDWVKAGRDFFDTKNFTSDLPVALFYDELLSMYPNALFILTIRSVKSWISSTRKAFPPTRSEGLRVQRNMAYSYDRFNQHMFPKRYIAHMLDVLKKIPCCQLLAMNIVEHGDAWGKLCPFMGRKIPKNKPFPAATPGGSRLSMYRTIPTDSSGNIITQGIKTPS